MQVPKVFDQVALRDCVTRTICLKKRSEQCCHPAFAFEGATDFDIVEVKVISKTDSLSRPGCKKLKIFVRVRYTVHYSDGAGQHSQCDEAAFNLTVNEIYCPSCIAQVGIIKSTADCSEGGHGKTLDCDGTLIKVEALVEAFNDVVNPNTGILTLDIGAFFVVKCECIVQLLIPAYGYCPVPSEQANPAVQNCKTFNDKRKTPFPSKFFPDQKWNPLDKQDCKKDC